MSERREKIMDPNEALREIRRLVDSVLHEGTEDAVLVLPDLAERVWALDDWLSRGGFPPEEWREGPDAAGEGRECANCGDEVSTLSSRDWCDGCEAEAPLLDLGPDKTGYLITAGPHESVDYAGSGIPAAARFVGCYGSRSAMEDSAWMYFTLNLAPNVYAVEHPRQGANAGRRWDLYVKD